jgi:hypothetical protein
MRVLLVLLVLLAGCDGYPWQDEADDPPVEVEVRERVVDEVLQRLSATYEEIGPMTPTKLKPIKDEAAQREGFADWEDFARRLRNTDPSWDVAVSERITARLKQLLAGT